MQIQNNILKEGKKALGYQTLDRIIISEPPLGFQENLRKFFTALSGNKQAATQDSKSPIFGVVGSRCLGDSAERKSQDEWFLEI